MKLAVGTAKVDVIKAQLLNLLGLGANDIVATPANYKGITLLNLNESAITTVSSIRNIDATSLNDAVAAELLQPTTTSEAPSFKSLDNVGQSEQYEHLGQLLHIQQAMRDRR